MYSKKLTTIKEGLETNKKTTIASVTLIAFLALNSLAYVFGVYQIFSNVIEDTVPEYELLTLQQSSDTGALYTNFTITGRLMLDGSGAVGRTVVLMRSPDNSTFTDIDTTTTDSGGFYAFEVNRTVAGLSYYQTRYDVTV